MQEFGLQIKRALLGVSKEPLISALFMLLIYLLSYYANFFAFHLLFLAFVFIEGYVILGIALSALLMLVILGCGFYAPVEPYLMPNVSGLNPVASMLYQIYFSLVNDVIIQMWEVSVMALSGLIFNRTLRMNYAFESIALMAVLLLLVIYDSDGLYLSDIASGFPMKDIDLSGQNRIEFIDVAVISSLNAMSVYLYFILWIAFRVSAWVHGGYQSFAKQASLLRLSYVYIIVMMAAVAFDYQWIRILKIPVYLCFLSMLVYFFEVKKFKRPEAILIALFVSFVIELLVPGFWLIVLGLVLLDCIVDLRRYMKSISVF